MYAYGFGKHQISTGSLWLQIKSEGMEDRLWILLRMCRDVHGDEFTILSDSFVLFFNISKERLGEYVLDFKDHRIELMQGVLIGRNFEEGDVIVEKVKEFGDMLLHSFEQYPKSIYLKAYYTIKYIATGKIGYLQAAVLSPYYIPPKVPEDKDSYMYA